MSFSIKCARCRPVESIPPPGPRPSGSNPPPILSRVFFRSCPTRLRRAIAPAPRISSSSKPLRRCARVARSGSITRRSRAFSFATSATVRASWADGPATHRLSDEMILVENFDVSARAQAGDFMKIFWSREVGGSEQGHSVFYLGTERQGGLDYVRFWSSNIPGGYGERSVPLSKIVHAIFSRLDAPANLSRAMTVPPVDRYLASLLTSRSSYEEAKAKCGM